MGNKQQPLVACVFPEAQCLPLSNNYWQGPQTHLLSSLCSGAANIPFGLNAVLRKEEIKEEERRRN